MAMNDPAAPPPAFPYARALRDVKRRVRKSRTSFRAGMVVLPRERRDAMYAFYGFCREVDDIADDSPTSELAAKGLRQWRGYIADLFRGIVSDPITAALLPAVGRFGLIEQDFQDIIDGMQMDSVAIVAPEAAMLDRYCDRVASAVGRVAVRIFGDGSASAMQVAHHLGRALQLTNILRDLGEDAARGRLYIPFELLKKYRVSARDPNDVLQCPELPALCRELADMAREYYAQADAAMARCDRIAMRPARIMRNYYHAVFERLVADDWRDPRRRVSLSVWHKLRLMLKGYRG